MSWLFVTLLCAVSADAQTDPETYPEKYNDESPPASHGDPEADDDYALPDREEEDEEEEEGVRRTPFDQGRIRFSFGAGGGVYGNRRYFAIALGAGYFLVSGLEIGVDINQWFGNDPQITKLSPQIRYILYMVAPISPYAGIFYRHWFFWTDSSQDIDTIGGRAGAVWAMGAFYLGGGVVYEAVISKCTLVCDVFYPEMTFGLSF